MFLCACEIKLEALIYCLLLEVLFIHSTAGIFDGINRLCFRKLSPIIHFQEMHNWMRGF
jgi:hypothetical protein